MGGDQFYGNFVSFYLFLFSQSISHLFIYLFIYLFTHFAHNFLTNWLNFVERKFQQYRALYTFMLTVPIFNYDYVGLRALPGVHVNNWSASRYFASQVF